MVVPARFRTQKFALSKVIRRVECPHPRAPDITSSIVHNYSNIKILYSQYEV
jgi:hypothetical protein